MRNTEIPSTEGIGAKYELDSNPNTVVSKQSEFETKSKVLYFQDPV